MQDLKISLREAWRRHEHPEQRQASAQAAEGESTQAARQRGDRCLILPEPQREQQDKGAGCVERMVLAENRCQTDEGSCLCVPRERRALEQATADPHGDHGKAGFVEFVARIHPEQSQDCERNNGPARSDDAADDQQPTPESEDLERRVRNPQGDDAVAEAAHECRSPVVATGVVGIEIAHRHGAMCRLLRAVPEEAFVREVEPQAPLKSKECADQRHSESPEPPGLGR